MYDAIVEEYLTPVYRLSRDMIQGMRQGGGGVTDNEARFLIDLYYSEQRQRIRINNQVKGLERDAQKTGRQAEPHSALDWLLGQKEQTEKNVATLLGIYAQTHEMGWFFDQTVGVGPIIAAGLLAHIDITRCDTAGDIWSFAGLNPESFWCSRDEARRLWKETSGGDLESRLRAVAAKIGRNPDNLLRMALVKPDGSEVPLSEAGCIAAIGRKPFNGALKTLCWKLGESFIKVSNKPTAHYGRLFKERKSREWARNIAGELAGQATAKLEKYSIGKSTDAYKWYSGACSPELAARMLDEDTTPTAKDCAAKTQGLPMLPPDHINSRARRWVEKLFLAHLHQRWREHLGLPVPAPWAIAHGGHAHLMEPPQRWPGADAA